MLENINLVGLKLDLKEIFQSSLLPRVFYCDFFFNPLLTSTRAEWVRKWTLLIQGLCDHPRSP